LIGVATKLAIPQPGVISKTNAKRIVVLGQLENSQLDWKKIFLACLFFLCLIVFVKSSAKFDFSERTLCATSRREHETDKT